MLISLLINMLDIYIYSNTFAQAGLVNGSNSYILPGSRTENITLLNSTSNIGEQGAWFFRISEFLPASMFIN